MIGKIKKYLWKTEGIDYSDPPQNVKGRFHLFYGKIFIGTLSFENGLWHFSYSDEFKKNSYLKPIIDFPDVNKEYECAELWPFFATRIPALNQPYHYKKIMRANASKDDTVALLKIFGSKAITNPYKLSFM